MHMKMIGMIVIVAIMVNTASLMFAGEKIGIIEVSPDWKLVESAAERNVNRETRQNFEQFINVLTELGIEYNVVPSSILLDKEKRDQYSIIIGRWLLTDKEYAGLKQYIADGGMCVFHYIGIPLFQDTNGDGLFNSYDKEKESKTWMRDLVGAKASYGCRKATAIVLKKENPITAGVFPIGEKKIKFEKPQPLIHGRLLPDTDQEVLIAADVDIDDVIVKNCPYIVIKKVGKGTGVWVLGKLELTDPYQKKILENLYKVRQGVLDRTPSGKK